MTKLTRQPDYAALLWILLGLFLLGLFLLGSIGLLPQQPQSPTATCTTKHLAYQGYANARGVNTIAVHTVPTGKTWQVGFLGLLARQSNANGAGEWAVFAATNLPPGPDANLAMVMTNVGQEVATVTTSVGVTLPEAATLGFGYYASHQYLVDLKEALYYWVSVFVEEGNV